MLLQAASGDNVVRKSGRTPIAFAQWALLGKGDPHQPVIDLLPILQDRVAASAAPVLGES